MKLTTENKIKIVSLAIVDIQELYSNNGLCTHLKRCGKRVLPETEDLLITFYAKKYFPELCHEYGAELAKKYRFKKPTSDVFWWDAYDGKIRIKFLKAYKKELKNLLLIEKNKQI